VFLEFDGVMANAQVWLNGHPVGGWPYGYNAFQVELTPHLRFGGTNVVAVRADTQQWGSRWYPGAGLYRHVWLVKTAPLHVAPWGVFITTPAVRDAQGTAHVAVTVNNAMDRECFATVDTEILELQPDGSPGRSVAHAQGAAIGVAPRASAGVKVRAEVPQPKRWDVIAPNLYLARVTVSCDGRVSDVYEQSFGFRTIEFTASDGFKLNGRRVPIQGVCLHHDLGPLGAAFNLRAAERQLEILKEMGCNAIRTAHNPPAPQVLDLCDRMGLLVMCEAFDCWKQGKAGNDYARLFDEWHERDLRAMVRRERNHPSVVLWSIGNEVHEQSGPDLAQSLAGIVRSEDPTRPVTAGANQANAGINGFQTAVDVFGLNYNINEYRRLLDHPGNESKPFLSTESASCISSRGEYFFPVARGESSRFNFQVSSYDLDAPSWAQSPDDAFAALDRHPRFMGEFVWTGFDYLGEPTPYDANLSNLLNFTDPGKRAAMQRELEALGKIRVPAASSYFGILDLCGFKKDRFHIYQARWRPDFPMAHILPHWNWPERVGQVTPVHVYTSGDQAELFLNGQSLGRKKKGQYEYRLRWDDVVYQPGQLEVVAYRNGKQWARHSVRTAGAAAQVLLEADRKEIAADGRDLSFVTVRIADKDALTVPRANHRLTFELTGPGEIVAVGNGDATSHEPFQARQRQAFNGLCLVIVRSLPDRTGPFTLKAESEGLRGGAVTLTGR
ncbi:MAG: DUF4982 domain-containing protein, partial [Verrucomicrobia bacterium]|nr:DUF4982 domain-containing protein [Verrucomicrobiota bacterium]